MKKPIVIGVIVLGVGITVGLVAYIGYTVYQEKSLEQQFYERRELYKQQIQECMDKFEGINRLEIITECLEKETADWQEWRRVRGLK